MIADVLHAAAAAQPPVTDNVRLGVLAVLVVVVVVPRVFGSGWTAPPPKGKKKGPARR